MRRWAAREQDKPQAGAEELNMTTIKLNDLTNDTEVNAREAAEVVGGPAYMKLGDIKGEVTDQDSSAVVFVGGWGSSMYQYS